MRGDSEWLENKSEYTFSTYQSDAAAMLARATAPVPATRVQGEVNVDWLGT